MKIVATTLLPAVDRPNADPWNAERSCQLKRTDKIDMQRLTNEVRDRARYLQKKPFLLQNPFLLLALWQS